jgi:hypothetical protein
MTSSQLGQKLHREHHFPLGFVLGIVAVVLIALALAWFATRPVPTPTVLPVEQPAVGQSVVVTGLRFDGMQYRSAPIAVSVPILQPAIGRSTVVTGLTFDGTAYRNADIAVAAHIYPRTYTVSALVFDEELGYHTEAIEVGGR